LKQNLETYGLHATVITAEAAAASSAIPRGTIDVVLLDPPREGARDLMAPLVALSPSRIAYVSCSPESLARDAAILVAGGYRLGAVEAIDMFPQTAHVEVVARFERVAARPPRR
jgi:23S rRNA (uracil1939-C5)-methyltransferase